MTHYDPITAVQPRIPRIGTKKQWLIGVRDDGTVRGITLGKETLREWANHIAQATHLHP